MPLNLVDKSILITGASSGIGEATALEAARQGARPLLVARREDELIRVARTIRERHGYEPLYYAADLSNQEQRESLVRFLEEKTDGIDFLVNNAGISSHGRFESTVTDVLRKTMEVNFFAMEDLTRRMIPLLRKKSGTKGILLVSTPAGLYGLPERYAYSASKAAGQMLMESLRFELEKDNIFTTVFCPGYTRTSLRTSGLSGDGTVLNEAQAKGAKSPEEVARILLKVLRNKRRIAFTDTNGRAVFLLRTLWPALLDRLIRIKLK